MSQRNPGGLSFEPRPTLILGLIYPAGIHADDMIEPLRHYLGEKEVGYGDIQTINLIKLTAEYVDGQVGRGERPEWESLLPFAKTVLETRSGEAAHVKAGQNLGDELRKKDVHTLGKIAAAWIPSYIVTGSKNKNQVKDAALRLPEGKIFIIKSLKLEEEVEYLRSLFGQRFVAIAGCSPLRDRSQFLTSETISRHEHQVRKAFQQADYFVDASDRESSMRDIDRLIRILFSDPARGPNRDEFGMFAAFGAARRSCDLSRQVGAAVADDLGSILAIGANEVPAPHGGTYWDPGVGAKADARDVGGEEDTSRRRKREALLGLISAISSLQGCTDETVKAAAEAIETSLKSGKLKASDIVENTYLDRVTDFGRAVHAEMGALLDAARRGVSIGGCTLFVTTFPCHNCARHVVASGIKRVVYIEPYPKSMASDLHGDAIWLSEEDGEDVREVRHADPIFEKSGIKAVKVAFERFLGVAPRFYSTAFSELRNMDAEGKVITRMDAEGKVIRWSLGPKNESTFPCRLRVQPFYMGTPKKELPGGIGNGTLIRGGTGNEGD